jgi:hypothetical protein
MKEHPEVAGPLSKIPTRQMGNGENMVEEAEGHCTSCKTKSKFDVEGTDTMKNGALRKYGKCKSDGCGRGMSVFASGKPKE